MRQADVRNSLEVVLCLLHLFAEDSPLSSREGSSPVLRSLDLPDEMDPSGELHRNGIRSQKGSEVKNRTVDDFTEVSLNSSFLEKKSTEVSRVKFSFEIAQTPQIGSASTQSF